MAHGERSPPPSLASFPDICAGRWRFAGEGLASMVSLSLSFELGFVSLCGGRGRPMGRTDGDKRLFLARSHPSIVRIGGGTQSANQSISFAVLMLRMVSRIRSTSAKEEGQRQINRRLGKVTNYNISILFLERGLYSGQK